VVKKDLARGKMSKEKPPAYMPQVSFSRNAIMTILVSGREAKSMMGRFISQPL
jgi:hypothetical protein